MAANLEIQNDVGDAITSYNFGAVNGGSYEEVRLSIENIGDTSASSVQVAVQRLAQNDGIDFASLALDVAGNPGVYSASALNLGTIAANITTYFWAKVTVPTGTTPAGNPRQFDIIATYTGT
jgi:hypothetical protein